MSPHKQRHKNFMSDTNYNFSILVVDNDEAMRFGLARELKKCGCTVVVSESVEYALNQLSNTEYDLVFCGMRFPGGAGGEELLKNVQQHDLGAAVVLVSCDMDRNRKQQLLLDGASYCFQKPIFKEQCMTLLSSYTGESSLPKAA